MGGGGKGGGVPGLGALMRMAKGVNAEVSPVRQEFLGQLMEALQTGGVGARIPIIQSAVERTGRAATDALAQTSNSLASSDLAGTPYGERILAQTGLGGEMMKSGVQTDILNQLLGTIPNYTMGLTSSAISGMGSAAQAGASSMQTGGKSGAALPAMLSAGAHAGPGLFEILKNVGGAIMGGKCWVAREVYGNSNPEWLLFRHWLLTQAPSWFRAFYIKHGPQIAQWISNKPRIKYLIRLWMNTRINKIPTTFRFLALGKEEFPHGA